MSSKPSQSWAATDQAVDYLRRKIEAGVLTPGQRLPPERDLARDIGVSRPSIRAALRSLAAMGVLETRHGSGSYITDGPPRLNSEPLALLAAMHGVTRDQLVEARRVLETSAAGLAAQQATPEQIATIADEVSGMFASVDDARLFRVHDVRFHQTLARASGNPVLAALVEMVSTVTFSRGRRSAAREQDLRETADQHRSIYLAVRAHNPERARREMEAHLPRLATENRASSADFVRSDGPSYQ